MSVFYSVLTKLLYPMLLSTVHYLIYPIFLRHRHRLCSTSDCSARTF